jgi:hypothetical protein
LKWVSRPLRQPEITKSGLSAHERKIVDAPEFTASEEMLAIARQVEDYAAVHYSEGG